MSSARRTNPGERANGEGRNSETGQEKNPEELWVLDTFLSADNLDKIFCTVLGGKSKMMMSQKRRRTGGGMSSCFERFKIIILIQFFLHFFLFQNGRRGRRRQWWRRRTEGEGKKTVSAISLKSINVWKCYYLQGGAGTGCCNLVPCSRRKWGWWGWAGWTVTRRKKWRVGLHYKKRLDLTGYKVFVTGPLWREQCNRTAGDGIQETPNMWYVVFSCVFYAASCLQQMRHTLRRWCPAVGQGMRKKRDLRLFLKLDEIDHQWGMNRTGADGWERKAMSNLKRNWVWISIR